MPKRWPRSGATPVEVRKREELAELDGLILPGGESTTMLKFLERGHLFDELKQFCSTRPVFGTCAGAILLAREVRNPAQRSLGVLDVVVERNAYGRQIDSSILFSDSKLPGEKLEMVFIRAPRIVETGPDVEVLAQRDGHADAGAAGQADGRNVSSGAHVGSACSQGFC